MSLSSMFWDSSTIVLPSAVNMLYMGPDVEHDHIGLPSLHYGLEVVGAYGVHGDRARSLYA